MKYYNMHIFDCDCGGSSLVKMDCNSEGFVSVRCPHCGKDRIAELPVNCNYKIRESTAIIWGNILGIFKELQPKLTVRQIYYALTVRGVVPKTKAGYRKTCYHLAKMRRIGIIPYGYIADNTRWHIKPTTYTGLAAAVDRMQQAYRRDLWADQPVYLEIWIEKDALAGVISPITQEYDVPLYVARGYGSMTFIYDAAEAIKVVDKPAFIYHFGDYDPSGVDAAHKIRDGLIDHGANFHFQRVAVTEEQIERLNLPTRETKKSDPRSKKWGNKPSVELDALPAPILREMVRDCIEGHIDPDVLRTTKQIEKLERGVLEKVLNNLVPVQNSELGDAQNNLVPVQNSESEGDHEV